MKLFLVRIAPWWVLRALWRCGIVDRTTVFRWEVSVACGRWETAAESRARVAKLDTEDDRHRGAA